MVGYQFMIQCMGSEEKSILWLNLIYLKIIIVSDSLLVGLNFFQVSFHCKYYLE